MKSNIKVCDIAFVVWSGDELLHSMLLTQKLHLNAFNSGLKTIDVEAQSNLSDGTIPVVN